MSVRADAENLHVNAACGDDPVLVFGAGMCRVLRRAVDHMQMLDRQIGHIREVGLQIGIKGLSVPPREPPVFVQPEAGHLPEAEATRRILRGKVLIHAERR